MKVIYFTYSTSYIEILFNYILELELVHTVCLRKKGKGNVKEIESEKQEKLGISSFIRR